MLITWRCDASGATISAPTSVCDLTSSNSAAVSAAGFFTGKSITLPFPFDHRSNVYCCPPTTWLSSASIVWRVPTTQCIVAGAVNAVAGGGRGLGTIATDDALGDVFRAAGFTRFRRATETPFNRVFEARK